MVGSWIPRQKHHDVTQSVGSQLLSASLGDWVSHGRSRMRFVWGQSRLRIKHWPEGGGLSGPGGVGFYFDLLEEIDIHGSSARMDVPGRREGCVSLVVVVVVSKRESKYGSVGSNGVITRRSLWVVEVWLGRNKAGTF